jgi:histone H3/H4
MKVIAPMRRKRKRGDGVEGIPASPPAPPPVEPPEALESPPAPEASGSKAGSTPENTPDTRGLIRKSAVRRFLKNEFAFPIQIREAFFAAIEAKFADDLRRSVTRARESKRNTLMTPDA